MAKTDYKNADEYLATFEPGVRKILETVRKVLRAAVPDAEEVIHYQIPAFRLPGGWVFYYSGYKAHFALSCPPPFAAFKAFATELAPYKKSVSAVQFPYDQPVPVALITRMAKHQAASLEAGKPAPQRAEKPSKPATAAAPAPAASAGRAGKTAAKAASTPKTAKPRRTKS